VEWGIRVAVPRRAATFVFSITRASDPLHSALLVSAVVVAAAVAIATKLRARRRYAKQKVSGGRKALVLNLFDR
jgi:multisubunit Na+/H+ antiporter MnhC subunit